MMVLKSERSFYVWCFPGEAIHRPRSCQQRGLTIDVWQRSQSSLNHRRKHGPGSFSSTNTKSCVCVYMPCVCLNVYIAHLTLQSH